MRQPPLLSAVEPATDARWHHHPVTVGDLVLYPCERQSVAGIAVGNGVVSLVADGTGAYLDECGVGEVPMPETFSEWEGPFSEEGFHFDASLREIARGTARNADEAVVLLLRADICEAAFRMLTGGGRFDAAEYDFRAAVPVSVVIGDGRRLQSRPSFAGVPSETSTTLNSPTDPAVQSRWRRSGCADHTDVCGAVAPCVAAIGQNITVWGVNIMMATVGRGRLGSTPNQAFQGQSFLLTSSVAR